MSNKLEIIEYRDIEFYGDQVIAVLVEENGQKTIYCPVKKLCANLGLHVQAQIERVRRKVALSKGARMVHVPSIGGKQETFCLRYDLIPYWLATVDEKRVKEQVQSKLIKYQEEVAKVLYDVFLGKGYHIGKRADPVQIELELKQKELDIARVKSNDRYLLAEQLDKLEKNKHIDQRWINHSRMLLVADITGQRIDFEMEVNLSDFLKEKGHRQVKGHASKKTRKQLKTGIREVNYYTVNDLPIIESAYEDWSRQPKPLNRIRNI